MHDISEYILLQLGEHAAVTVYSCVIGGAALLACLLTVLVAKLRKLRVDTALSLCLFGGLGALVMSRLFYAAANYTIIEAYADTYGAGFFLSGWMGGYNLYGAILGGIGAVALYTWLTRKDFLQCLDTVAPGGVLVIMAERFAEYFTDQGLGHYLEPADEEAGFVFPIGVQGPYGDWQLPVFFYDGILLLITLAVVLCLLKAAPGKAGLTAIALVGLIMIVTESLREDDIIRFGFVRFNQLCAAITVAGVLAASIVTRVRQNGWTLWQKLRIVFFLLGVALVIGIEFALDKSTIENTILYGVMVLTVIMMGVMTLYGGKKTRT